MLNDQLGDCTIAGCGHAVQVWSAALGQELTIGDADILKAYESWDGYNPKDPSTDQGGVELEVLANWRKNALGGHGLLAFAAVNRANLDRVRQAINLFGGVYIGLDLPETAQTQDVWDATTLDGSGAPRSWGGHCVFVAGYDEHGFTCITWGELKKMTLAFWSAYCDEAYALLGADWLGAKVSPEGFDLVTLQADLEAIG
jgi:hypothetical protein